MLHTVSYRECNVRLIWGRTDSIGLNYLKSLCEYMIELALEHQWTPRAVFFFWQTHILLLMWSPSNISSKKGSKPLSTKHELLIHNFQKSQISQIQPNNPSSLHEAYFPNPLCTHCTSGLNSDHHNK